MCVRFGGNDPNFNRKIILPDERVLKQTKLLNLRRYQSKWDLKSSGDDKKTINVLYGYVLLLYTYTLSALIDENQNVLIFSFDEFVFDRLQFWLTSNIYFPRYRCDEYTRMRISKELFFFIVNVYLYLVCIYIVYVYFVCYYIFKKLKLLKIKS